MLPVPRLNARLLVGGENKVLGSKPLFLPDTLVEVENRTGGKIQLRCRQGWMASLLSQHPRVAPRISAARPWSRTSWRRAAIEKRHRGRHPAMRQFTSESFYLNDETGEKQA
jgi:hypothetical protein